MNEPELKPPAVQAALDDNRNYLRAITDMAAGGKVVTHDAVYNDKGIKLLDKGMRVDASLYDRLVRHKLRGNIEDRLTVDDAVTVHTLMQVARELCQHDTLAYLLVHTLDEAGDGTDRLVAPLGRVRLTQQLGFKLTVMREQLPAYFTHSVLMTLVSIYLGLKSGWDDQQCMLLATAALLHDLGVMHMDPAWHDPANKITGVGRKQLLVHPITAMLMAREQKIYPKSVGQAILEHHEAMDGSGYPRGVPGSEISPMGQILIVAEVVSAFFEKYADDVPAQRLSLALRLHHRKYPPRLVAHLLPALQIKAVQSHIEVSQEQVQVIIGVLSQAFDAWSAQRQQLPAACFDEEGGSASLLVAQRLDALQKNLLEAGSHPRQLAEALPYLVGDAEGLAELALVGREALWQLQSIIDTVNSRWPELAEPSGECDSGVAQWRDACMAQMAGLPA